MTTPARVLLDNGLTLMLAPSPAPVATVSVHVAGGFRDEPEGFAGLAHLFEHLAFGGSERFGRGEHFARVEGAGGRCGAHTRHDYTEFFDVAPPEMLPLLVDLAADRLRAPLLDAGTLAVQRDVVLAEIATQHHGTPYGGLPWIHLPPVLHEGWALTHDGYGTAEALARVTPGVAREYFADRYAPGRVVVVLEGALGDVEAARDLAARAFGAVEPRPAAALPDLADPHADPHPGPDRDRHERRRFANVPQPVCAVGLRLPSPLQAAAYRGCTALPLLLPGALAAAGWAGASVRCGWFGRPYDTAGPDVLSVLAPVGPAAGGDAVLGAVRDALTALTDAAPPAPILRRLEAVRRLAAHQQGQVPGARARRLGAATTVAAALRTPGRPLDVPDPSADAPVSGADLAAAARALLARPAATLVAEPSRADREAA